MSAHQCYHVHFALFHSPYRLLLLLACVVMPMARSYCHLLSLSPLSLSALRNSMLNYYGPRPFTTSVYLLALHSLSWAKKKVFCLSPFHFKPLPSICSLSFLSHMYHFLLFLLFFTSALLVF